MTACPTLQTLEAFAAGSSAGDVELYVHSHIQSCDDCLHRIEEIRSNNALLGELAGIEAIGSGARPGGQAVGPGDGSDTGTGAGPRDHDLVAGYEIKETIARGAQGVVYRAVQKHTKRTVALKLLIGGRFASTRQRSRFEREVELAAALRHPNIITVFDSGMTEDGRHYLVMEYLEGRALDQYLATARDAQPPRPLSVNDTLRLFLKVCTALEYAHQRGVIHRDLKPANILVDASGEPRVVDFGLAKLKGGNEILSNQPTITASGEFAGTFAYASPEQTLGKPDLVDVRSDVYSLGIILYEMLTGDLPYQTTGSIAQVLRAIADAAPARPSQIRPEVDNEVETILLKTLNKDPDRRYQSAGQLARDVERYLAHEPIDAKRDSVWYVLRKTVRRYRLPFVLATGVVLTLAILALAMSVLYRSKSVAEAEAASRSRQLAEMLAAANIERGRAMGQAGNTALAEEILWTEFFRSDAEKPADASDPRDVMDPRAVVAAQVAATAPTSSPDVSRSAARWALWELYHRQPCLRTIALPDTTLSISFVPKRDAVVFTTSNESTVRLFDLGGTGAVKNLFDGPPPGEGRYMLLGGNGQRLVAFSATDSQLYSYSLDDGRLTAAHHGHPVRITSAALSSDGSLLATGDQDGLVQLWDAATLTRKARLEGHSKRIRGMAFMPDSRILATSSEDLTIRFWNMQTLNGLVSPISPREYAVELMAFSPDGKRLAVAGEDDRAVYELPTFARLRELPKHAGAVRSLQFSPDGQRLATGSNDRVVRVHDLNSGRTEELAGHTGGVQGVLFDEESGGATLRTLSMVDRTVRVWDVRPNRGTRTLAGHRNAIVSANYAGDRVTLVTGSGDGTVRLWDVTTGAETGELETDTVVHSVAVSSRGAIASGHRDGAIRIWDTARRTPRTVLTGHTQNINSIAFSPDGTLIASTCQDQTLKLWEVDSGRCVATIDAAEPLAKVCFSPDGKRMAAGGKRTHLVRVWDVASRSLVASLAGHTAAVRVACFFPDGRRLATGSDDQSVRFWDTNTGACEAVLQEHSIAVYGLSFNGAGDLLASSGGSEVKIWDVANRRSLATLSRDSETIFGVDLSPDAGRLTAWGSNKLVTVWDLTSSEVSIAGNLPYWRARLARTGASTRSAAAPPPGR